MPAEEMPQSPGPDGRPPEEQPKWRRDFPVDVPRDEYVARRDFAKFMILTSGAFTVGQFWIGFRHLLGSREAHVERPIARVAEVPVGAAVTFYYPHEEEPCLLMRPTENTWLAYSQKCTHLACAIQPRVEDGELICPCHKAAFDLASGRPIYGPPTRPLPRIELAVRGDTVYATAVELRT